MVGSARAYLELKELWRAVEAEATNAEANLQAKSELVLMMDKALFPHIRNCILSLVLSIRTFFVAFLKIPVGISDILNLQISIFC